MFDYKHVTDDTQKEYEAVLASHADKAREWITTNRAAKDEPIERSYELWWMFRGPTGFRSNDQALRFKKELFAFLSRIPVTTAE